MKKLLLIWLAAFAAVSCAQEKQPSKPLYMWFDCEANYATLSHPDSIRYYVSKIHDMGFTDVVVDVKSIMGETLYKSDIAPYMGEWEGVTRPENYDLLGYFIEEGHKLGMRVHGSLNVFAGGHNFFDRGIIYGDHADWQSQVYTEGKIVPISEIKSNYNGMLNPANPEVQEYELAILKEFAGKYPDVDTSSSTGCVSTISPPISVRCRRSFSKLTPERKSPIIPVIYSAGRRMPTASGAGRRARCSASGSNGAHRLSRTS